MASMMTEVMDWGHSDEDMMPPIGGRVPGP